MSIPTEEIVYVDVPAGVRVDEGGGERAAGQSGGRIRITSVALSREDVVGQIEDFADAVNEAALALSKPKEPAAYRAPVEAA